MNAKIKTLVTVPVLVFSLLGCNSTFSSMAIGNISSEMLVADYPEFASQNSGFIISDTERLVVEN